MSDGAPPVTILLVPAAPAAGRRTSVVDDRASRRRVLGYAGAEVVEAACTRVPVSRDMIGESGLVEDDGARAKIRQALEGPADHVAAGPPGAPATPPA
jgi:chromate reductase, NAD(P)H dehydrogenase (quinone)